MRDGSQTFTLLSTGRHACPYLDDRTACTQVVDPSAPLTPQLYEQLLEHGFRRSGHHVYRPRCPACTSCRSLRLDADRFSPSRRHRRCVRRNADLHVAPKPARLTPEQRRLFDHYVLERHGDEEMASGDPHTFLTAPWCSTIFYEFRDEPDGRLLAVVVTDLLPHGLSAVYTFYDLDAAPRSLGTLGILWQVSELRRLRGKRLYLGYWIEEAPRMGYKAEFRPHEVHQPETNQWVEIGE